MKRYVRMTMFAVTAIAMLALAQPALGYTELGTTGTVGAHKLIDTSSNPGAICIYKFMSLDGVWQLKHMYVNPPRMKAVLGQGTEKVAWQFTIQRRTAGFGGVGPWSNRYTSAKFFAFTDSSQYASFEQQGVKVIVPFEFGSDASAAYRAIVKLFWYTSGGDVLGTATERVDWYYQYEELDTFLAHHACGDYD